MNVISKADEPVWRAIQAESRRQQDGLEMIASENYTSAAIMAAQGCVLTNKYAEGYPGKRYYGGCEFVDVVERLAIERAMQLFSAEAANVQPHSGAAANMAVYFAALNPGDTILAMNLSHGGHLTHGIHLNFSGKLYKVIPYGVRKDTERLDYDAIRELAREHRPKMLVAGASAYSRVIDFSLLAEIARETNMLFLVDMAHIAGLVAGDQHPSPVPWADFVTSTTHKTLRGPRSGFILSKKDWAAKINQSVFPGVQGGPLMHVIAAKAIGFGEALLPSFRSYAAQVVANARTLANELIQKGFRIVSGGTDNHLLLVDVTSKGLTGKKAEKALDSAGITVNRNSIPFDSRPPLDPSGIRIGTPALTTRGMREPEMRLIGNWISDILAHPDDSSVLDRIRGQVLELCRSFSVPHPPEQN
ncbi:MAG: serine hydroxymethyltransferase [Gemmataceae bacterium]